MTIPYWSTSTLIIYICMGFLGYWSVVHSERKRLLSGRKKFNRYDFILIIIWDIFATFRYVNSSGIGGMDAHSYIEFFNVCLNDNINYRFLHYELLYRIFNRLVRFYTSNYHFFFAIIYAFIIYAYLLFIKEYALKYINYIPFILIIYIYIRGFCTIRTNFAVAFLLVSLVMLKRNRKVLSIILAIASIYIQKISVIYVGYLLFYWIFNEKITIKKTIVITVVAYWIGIIGRIIVRTGVLGWAYSYYASQSLIYSFFDNFWKISFEQMVVIGLSILFRNHIKKDINSFDKENTKRLKLIFSMCMYDMIMIPLSYILWIWRAYEFFYIPRLVMCGELISIINRKFVTVESRKIINMLLFILFILWMIFRWYNTWEDSGLMPYIFQLFV